jgi:thioesterase domain-containing protein/acyl carrier protein
LSVRPAQTSGLPLNDVVARAWRQVLDKRSFEADVPFDQAGGDSLRLMKLIFLLEEDSGLRLPMEACHVGLRPTGFASVLELAMHLRDGAPSEPPGTVFLIPGMGGETPLEGGFIAACAPALHVATVDLPDWPEMMAPTFRMEDLIERTAAEIMQRAPDGPIRLAGFSLGGHVAFGAAQVLQSRGRTIGFFGILDTNTALKQRLVARGPAPIRTLRYARWEMHNLAKAARRGEASDKLGELTAQLLTQPGKTWRLRLAARWRHMKLPASYAMYLNIYLREQLQSRLLRIWQTEGSYGPRTLHAPVVLFRSEEHTADEPADLGWSELCPDLHEVNVTGNHRSMLQPPHLANLCAQFIREVNGVDGIARRQLVA